MKYIILLLLATSCTITKDITKTKTDEVKQTETKSVETTTITEVAKDTVNSNSSTLNVETPITQLLTGDSSRTETETNIITNKIINGKLHTKVFNKAQKIPVNINRTTVKNASVTVNENVRVKSKVTVKKIEKESVFSWWWLLLIPLIVIVWKWVRG